MVTFSLYFRSEWFLNLGESIVTSGGQEEDFLRALKYDPYYRGLLLTIGLLFAIASLAAAGDDDYYRLANQTIEGQTVVANSEGSREGAGLKLTGPGALELTALNLKSNTVRVETPKGENQGAQGGGAYLADFSFLGVTNCQFTQNLVVAKDGTFAHGGGLSLFRDEAMILNQVKFDANVATVEGASRTPARGGSLPSASARGGAISVLNQAKVQPIYAKPKLTRFIVNEGAFNDNKVVANGPRTASQGGAVAIMGHVAAKFDGSKDPIVFANNQALAGPTSGGVAEGGAVVAMSNPAPKLAFDLLPEIDFKKVVFRGNLARSESPVSGRLDVRGGAISLMAKERKANINYCHFEGNRLENQTVESENGKGQSRGGAVYSGNGLTIENSNFISNQALAKGASLGGALELAGAYNVVKRSLFEDNLAIGGAKDLGEKYKGAIGGQGGAIYISGSLAFIHGVFEGNQATGLTAAGGAIFVGSKSKLTLIDSYLVKNQAIGQTALGGAIYVANGGQLLLAVNDKYSMVIRGNLASSTKELAKPSGIYLAPPEKEAEKLNPPPQDSKQERPKEPEPDDLIVRTGKEAKLLVFDPIIGVAASIAKEGPGTLNLADRHLAVSWNIQEGDLKLSASPEGQGAVLIAKEKLVFANKKTSLVMEPAPNQPHALIAASLVLPKTIKVALPKNAAAWPGNHVILKLRGGAEKLKGVASRKYEGQLTRAEESRPYRLEWNAKGELLFSLGPA
ncbi:MAG: hypothetical protein LBI10_02340 [Deltaproteobacteria bacterium]|jgi:hypothetical protein|nr:hypothetical protein [Deltaproteobacteria bacterium]